MLEHRVDVTRLRTKGIDKVYISIFTYIIDFVGGNLIFDAILRILHYDCFGDTVLNLG